MDEGYWRDFRAKARKRTSMKMLLLIAPLGIIVAILKILGPMDYPAGDIRNSIEFRLVFYGLWIVIDLIFIAVASRWLRADGRQRR